MPSPQSLRRLANLTKKVRDDMRSGGMAVNFRYLFRSTAILARVVEILADHVATEAEEKQAREATAERTSEEVIAEALQDGTESDSAEDEPSTEGRSAKRTRAAADS